MSETIGIGVVGYGFIGKVRAHVYRSLAFYYSSLPVEPRLVGVCTSGEETARAARAHGGFRFYTTHVNELLLCDEIRIIDICTPNHLHCPQVVAALQAGKHVYCDKPLCVNAEEARVILNAAQQAKQCRGQMAFHYRFVPAVLRARQLVDEGFVGRVFHFRVAYYHSGYTDPERPMSWRLRRKHAGGGALFDLGSHAVDLARHLVGEIVRVFAQLPTFIGERPTAPGSAEREPVDVDDYAALLVETESGATGIIEASRMASGSNDRLWFEIYGEHGALRWDLEDPLWLYAFDARAPGEPIGGRRGWTRIECVQRYPAPAALPGEKCAPGWERFHAAAQYHFLECICQGREPSPSLADGAQCQFVLEAAQVSAQRRGWVEVREVAEGAVRSV